MKRQRPGIFDGERWAVVPTAVGDNHLAIVVLDCDNAAAPIPAYLVITTKPAGGLTNGEILTALAGFDPEKTYSPITADTLRSLGLGQISQQWAVENAETVISPETLNRTRHELRSLGDLDDIEWPKGGYAGFRRKIDLKAAFDRALAANLYELALADGEAAPTQDVAQVLGIAPTAARDLISRARRDGYLSAGSQGRRGGVLTQEGLDVMNAVFALRKGKKS
jgi:hypothetical protein